MTGKKQRRDAGIARIFQRGVGGGVTLSQNEDTHQIVMSFLSPVVGCLLKKAHKGGRGRHGHPRTPWLHPYSVSSHFLEQLSK